VVLQPKSILFAIEKGIHLMLYFPLVSVPTIIICRLYWMGFGYQYDMDGEVGPKR